MFVEIDSIDEVFSASKEVDLELWSLRLQVIPELSEIL
jgi:hypothetical protein